MPAVLEEFPGRTRNRKWDEVFSDCDHGKTYAYTTAEFDCAPASFRAAAKQYAKRQGLTVRTAKTQNGVAIEFTNGEAPKKKRK